MYAGEIYILDGPLLYYFAQAADAKCSISPPASRVRGEPAAWLSTHDDDALMLMLALE